MSSPLHTRPAHLCTVALLLGWAMTQLLYAQTSSPSPAPSSTAQVPPPLSGLPAEPESPAAAYAVSASPAPDPRKPPPSKPGALTLQQVVEIARARNPTLLSAQANLRSVRAQELQAGVRTNPYLGVDASNVTLPANGSQANPYAYAVQVSRLFERGNKREYRLEDARATTAQTEAQLNDTVRQTVLAVKQAFTHMLIAKVALELARANIKDFQHEVDIANERYEAGDIGKLDFERIDLQLGSFESDQANAEINLLQAADQLQTLLGTETPSPDFDIIGDIIPPVVTQSKATSRGPPSRIARITPPRDTGLLSPRLPHGLLSRTARAIPRSRASTTGRAHTTLQASTSTFRFVSSTKTRETGGSAHPDRSDSPDRDRRAQPGRL